MKRNVAIIGYGVEGEVAYQYWSALGDSVTVHDANEAVTLPAGVKGLLGSDYLKNLGKYDLIVRSPGVKPWEIVAKNVPVTSVVSEFLAKCPARVIGVTGTKGKGTTSSLIARILGEAGIRTWLGGNIGRPPLEFLDKVRANHMVVLELSSFQLMDVKSSPHIAVCLMIVPEHMDWHRSVREYVAAKGNIFWHQKPDDVAVYNPENECSKDIAQLSPGTKVPYLEAPGAVVADGRISIGGEDICGIDEVGLVGPHNLENVCAAVTATWEVVKRDPKPVRRAVVAFKGLEHRLERVGTVGGIAFVNDSYSANPVAAIAAIKSFEQPKVVILGGFDRGADFGKLARQVAKSDVRRVLVVGQTASRIESSLRECGYRAVSHGGKTMSEIVERAHKAAEPGDVVLLSPGCPSFDMFKNFTERGDQFRETVAKLEGKR